MGIIDKAFIAIIALFVILGIRFIIEGLLWWYQNLSQADFLFFIATTVVLILGIIGVMMRYLFFM